MNHLIYGETFDAYAARPGMNATALKAGAVSMKAMRYQITHGKETTPALDFGKIAHTAVLEGGLSRAAFAVWEGGRRAGKVFDAFAESAAADGKTVINADERDELEAIVKAVHSDPEAHQIIEETKHEVVATWTAALGLAKCRCDGISAEWLFDWKTTTKATTHEIERQFYSLRYDLQMAHYLDGAMACGLTPRVRIISTCKSAPYDTVVWQPDDALMEYALEERDRIWREYSQCVAANRFPGIGEGRTRIWALPDWAMDKKELNLED